MQKTKQVRIFKVIRYVNIYGFLNAFLRKRTNKGMKKEEEAGWGGGEGKGGGGGSYEQRETTVMYYTYSW